MSNFLHHMGKKQTLLTKLYSFIPFIIVMKMGKKCRRSITSQYIYIKLNAICLHAFIWNNLFTNIYTYVIVFVLFVLFTHSFLLFIIMRLENTWHLLSRSFFNHGCKQLMRTIIAEFVHICDSWEFLDNHSFCCCCFLLCYSYCILYYEFRKTTFLQEQQHNTKID